MSNFDTSLIELDPESIHVGVHVKNIRTYFDDARLRELADSIYREGLMNPLTVMEAEDASGNAIVELIAGERRLRAIKFIQANIDANFMAAGVPCIQYVGAMQDAEFQNASENIDREQVDEVDIAAWLFARTEDGVSQTLLAEKLHKSLTYVNQRVVFYERSCEELRQALREGLLSTSAAYELAKNCDKDEQKKRIDRARKFHEKISLEEARQANKPDVTGKPSKKARDKMRAETEALAATSPVARGVNVALRWVEGLQTEEELREVLEG